MPQPIAIIPAPQILKMQDGVFTLNENAAIACSVEGMPAARLIQKLTGCALNQSTGAIRLVLDPTVHGSEAYRLDIDQNGVWIAASTPAGLFYGAQTFRQILPAEAELGPIRLPVDLPRLHIEDAPRFAHRGFLLDVSRHFFGKDEIKRLIDLMAIQKLNRFHWHLTDDQGWRIEIKKYPLLTEIGAFRKETQVAGWLFSKPVFDAKPHGGFYTQDDVREIVAYAGENFIEVIPEIDAPGHAVAAIAAYPELSCAQKAVEVRTSFGAFSDPLCAGKDSVYAFLDDVFSEIAGLFPYKHIHIGGDEVNKTAWKKCPHCQARKHEAGLKNEHALQIHFENRLVKIIKSKGCQVIGWNDIMDDHLDGSLINQYWIYFKKKKTIAELKHGRKTIISDFGSLYLDYSYKVTELAKTYTCEPQFAGVTDEEAQNIIGVESALWTEFVDTRQRIDWQMFPRILAISEMAWTSKSGRNYADFLTRLGQFEKRLDILDVHHATRDCYLKYQKISKMPQALRILLASEHPALVEYREHHPSHP